MIEAHELDKIAEVDAIEGKHPDLGTLQTMESLFTQAVAYQEITANCSTKYRATKSSGKRPLDQIWISVQHSTEGDTARGAASWFANPSSAGSAHRCMDNNECYRTLDDDDIPWGAPGANYHGMHQEQAGYAKWTTLMWSKQHRKLLERDAFKTAVDCRKYDIPPYFLKAAQLKPIAQGTKVKGITTHWECTQAFGGSHTDPGKGWPRLYFMMRVRYHHKRLSHIQSVV